MTEEPTVQIVFPASGHRTGSIQLPWVKGKKIKHYLKSPFLHGQGLLAVRNSCRLMNDKRKRMRLADELLPNSTLFLVRTR